jgi:hypothetical protein
VDTLAEALARANHSQAADIVGKLTEQQNRQVRPSNAFTPGVSPFSYPEGDVARPKPTFHQQVFYNGHHEELDQLTPAEIDAYNALSRSLAGPEARRTARNGTWEARISRNNDQLQIFVPCKTQEQLQNLPPSLILIIRELMDGKTIDPTDLLSQVDALRARVAELEGPRA